MAHEAQAPKKTRKKRHGTPMTAEQLERSTGTRGASQKRPRASSKASGVSGVSKGKKAPSKSSLVQAAKGSEGVKASQRAAAAKGSGATKGTLESAPGMAPLLRLDPELWPVEDAYVQGPSDAGLLAAVVGDLKRFGALELEFRAGSCPLEVHVALSGVDHARLFRLQDRARALGHLLLAWYEPGSDEGSSWLALHLARLAEDGWSVPLPNPVRFGPGRHRAQLRWLDDPSREQQRALRQLGGTLLAQGERGALFGGGLLAPFGAGGRVPVVWIFVLNENLSGEVNLVRGQLAGVQLGSFSMMPVAGERTLEALTTRHYALELGLVTPVPELFPC